ncbi:MAG: tetratricopeptide repeat protein [Candidatus Omnitrophota bacterium]|nr:tetratricopeptide repeat protein [Candidatus Omnitrophota bacterium]
MNSQLKIRLSLFFLLFGLVTLVYAAGTSSSSWGSRKSSNTSQEAASVSLYDQGVAAHKNGDYQKAKRLFEQALREDSNNPDILNMLAHTQLKLGMIDQSLANYKRALSIRPRFPEAREYLGEAYIQAALREIETLKGYGTEGAEQLEDLVKEFKKAAGTL